MRSIAILSDNKSLGKQLFNWTKNFCEKKGLFPTVKVYEDSEEFYKTANRENPSGFIVALSGVAGLNASERLRSICPESGVIWCSDIDFALQAYRLRVKYFIKAPMSNEELCKGLRLLI